MPWAPRLPGGPLKGFFIPSVSQGRDMVELMQRLALDPTTVTIDRQWDVNCWGIGDFYGHEYRGDRDDFQTVYGYVEQELTSDKRFEVLLVPGLNGWSRLTRASRDAILRRVQEGAGLVLLHPFVGDVKGHPFKGDEAEGDRRIWEVSPLVGVPDDFVSERGYPELNAAAITQARWTPKGRHFITEGVPLDLIPSGRSGGRFYNYDARGDVLDRGRRAAGARREGLRQGTGGGLRLRGGRLPPRGRGPRRVAGLLGLLGVPVLAPGPEPALGGGTRERRRVAGARAPRDVAVPRPPGAQRPGARRLVEVTARSEFGPSGAPFRDRRSLPAGTTSLSVAAERFRPTRRIRRGTPDRRRHRSRRRHRRDPRLGTATFEVAKRATVARLKPNAAVYRAGDTVSVVTQAAGRLDGLQVRLEMRDDLGRLLSREEKPTGGEKTQFFRLDDFLGKRAFLSASLVEGERIVDQLRAEPVVVVQRERRSKEYRALMSFESPRPELAPLRQRRLRALAMDSGFTWGGKVNDSLEVPRGWFGVYWYDRGPTTPEGLDEAIREFERTGDFASLQYLTKKRALQAHRRHEVPGAEPQPRRPRGAADPGRGVRHGRPQQGRLQHGLLLRGRRGLAHLVRRSRGLLLRAPHPGPLPEVAEDAVRLARRR